MVINNHPRLLLVTTIIMMMIILVIVVETMATMEIPLTLEKNHQVNLATPQGEEMKKDQLVIHNIKIIYKANHQDQIYQLKESRVELILLS